MWVKRSGLGTGGGHQEIVSTNATDQFGFRFDGDNKLDIFEYSVSGNNYPLRLTTNKVFRDTNAFYSIVLQVDTPNATSSNRAKLWINGVQETSFSTATYPSQDLALTWNKNGLHQIGSKAWGNSGNGSDFFDGYLSHVANVAGSVVAPTVFGSTDATSGIWKFKSPSGVTWGTNGFHLKFENSGNLGLDSSGNSNTFTVGGNGRQALDTPSNVYATFNSLWIQRANNVQPAFSNANLTSTFNNAGTNEQGVSTLAVSSGKWYAEIKWDNATANTATSTGIFPVDYFDGDPFPAAYLYLADGTSRSKNSASSYGNSYTTGDIIGIALDLDNNKLYFSKNGTFQNSGVPTSGSTGTGAISIIADTYYMYCSDYASSGNRQASANFGNGYFGTAAISSAGSNGNGSLFEYDVPSGYYALNTKNINTYG
jgi:hypothetical protein